METIKRYFFANLIGLLMLAGGWFISSYNAITGGFNTVQLVGLAIIVAGAYLPEIWVGIGKAISGSGEKKP